jgi:hypothetical protein
MAADLSHSHYHAGEERKMAGKPVELQFITRKVVKGLEWSAREGMTPHVGVSGDDPSTWDKVGEALAGDFRVVAVNPETPYDLLNVIWATREPAVVMAQGKKACAMAARTAIQGPGSIRALVLIEFGAAASNQWLREIAVPTLVLRGRQSKVQSHKDAVAVHELIGNSHLIEPEDCGDRPVEGHADVLLQAVRWYFGSLGAQHMDYPVNGEPIDPKAG